VTLACPPAAGAATLTVTTTTDELNTDGDCSLREAVRAANLDDPVDACPTGAGTDLIDVPAGNYLFATTGTSGANEDAALTGDLDLTSSMTIAGAGAGATVIDGNDEAFPMFIGTDRVFDVLEPVGQPEPEVTLTGMTVRDGRTSAGGGGIQARSGTRVDLSNLVVTSNIAPTGGGGGLWVERSAVTATSTQITDNDAATGGAGIVNNRSQLTISSSTISGNGEREASGGEPQTIWGGGIFSIGPTAVIESTVSANEAVDGAGIYHESPDDPGDTPADLVVERSTIGPSNRAGTNGPDDGDGDGILVTGIQGGAAVTASTISGNGGATTDGGRGGGIYAQRPVTLRDVTFHFNGASSGGGGGHVFAGDGGAVSFRNTLVSADGGGGSCETTGTGTLTSQGENQEYFGGSFPKCNFNQPGDENIPDLLQPSEFGPLADNGGPTATHALFPGARPVDAGGGCLSPDQRGIGRPQRGICDVGAFELDTVPDTFIDSGPSGTTTTSTPTFTFSADEPDTGFGCSIDGGPFFDCASPFTTPSLANGPHTFAVRAVEGNDVDPSPATRSFTVVAPTGAGGGGTGGGGAGAIPSVAGFRFVPAVFRLARFRTPLRLSASAAPRGTTIRYTLSTAATVRITIYREAAGRRVGRRCRRPSRRLLRRRRCTRLVRRGTLVRTGSTGANRVPFSGRLGRRALPPGRYRGRIVASATGAPRESAPRTARFRIVRR
jgi:CSLREA domain-containing protein